MKKANRAKKQSKRAAKPVRAKKPAAKKAAHKGAAQKSAARKSAAKPKRAAPKRVATKKSTSKPASKQKPAAKRAAKPAGGDVRWTKFVEEHGVVLASARGPVPSVAEAIAGEPIVGSWWSHPKAHAIFDALSAIDDSDEVRCFKLVDKKITLVHRRLWPALAKLASSGVLPADRVASIQQEHMPTGEHRNFTTPFPDWVPDDVMLASESLSIDDARDLLGTWA